MSEEPSKGRSDQEGARELQTTFETAPDHVIAYIDHFNLAVTGSEVILSAYQTIPGYPSPEGPRTATSTRRATLILNPAHALELGQLLVKHGRRFVETEEP